MFSSRRQAAVEAGVAIAVVRNATAGEAVAVAAGHAALVPDCAAVVKAVRQLAAAVAKLWRLHSPVATSRPDATGLERPGLLPSKWRAQWLPARRHAEATPRMEAVLAMRSYGEVTCSTAGMCLESCCAAHALGATCRLMQWAWEYRRPCKGSYQKQSVPSCCTIGPRKGRNAVQVPLQNNEVADARSAVRELILRKHLEASVTCLLERGNAGGPTGAAAHYV